MTLAIRNFLLELLFLTDDCRLNKTHSPETGLEQARLSLVVAAAWAYFSLAVEA